METYDICMLVVLVGTTVFGAWKGMAWQVASTASLVASYAVALRFSAPLAHHFGQQAPLNRFIAMFALFAGTSMAIWLIFRIVAGFLNRVRLKEFDRQMGALFGAAKGVLLCVAITFFAVTLSARARTAVLSSRSGYYIAVLLQRADAVMPKEIHEVLDPYLKKLEQELDPTRQPSGGQDPAAGSHAKQGGGERFRIVPWELTRYDRASRHRAISPAIQGPNPNIRNIIGRWGRETNCRFNRAAIRLASPRAV